MKTKHSPIIGLMKKSKCKIWNSIAYTYMQMISATQDVNGERYTREPQLSINSMTIVSTEDVDLITYNTYRK